MPEKVSTFKQRFTTIKGTSEVRRLPRLGKIRLGVKVLNKEINKAKCKCKIPGNPGCFYCTHPKETEYFVCPEEVKQAYKEEFPDGKITILDVMFPINDHGVVFPQAYKFYGSSKGLKCIGDGRIALKFSEDKKGGEEIECPCNLLEEGKCKQRAHLLVMLPKVNMGGIYQIDIGSFHSIVDINSGIDYVKHLAFEILGVERFALIPLVLKREWKETHHKGQKQIHHTLHLYPNISAEHWNKIKGDFRIIAPDEQLALPAIEDISPAFDEGATVVEVEEIEEDKSPDGKSGSETTQEKEIAQPHTTETTKHRLDYIAEAKRMLAQIYTGENEDDMENEKKLMHRLFGTDNWIKISKMSLDKIKSGVENLKEELHDEELPF